MSIRPFGRLRVGNGEPAASSLRVGELVASRQGVLYLGVGTVAGGTATSVVTFGGTGLSVAQEKGSVVYSDETAQSGTTYLLLAAPVNLTLTHVSAVTGAGTCLVQLSSQGTAIGQAVSASSTLSRQLLAGSSVSRRVEEGQSIQLTVSNANNLTSLIVQVEWLEG